MLSELSNEWEKVEKSGPNAMGAENESSPVKKNRFLLPGFHSAEQSARRSGGTSKTKKQGSRYPKGTAEPWGVLRLGENWELAKRHHEKGQMTWPPRQDKVPLS